MATTNPALSNLSDMTAAQRRRIFRQLGSLQRTTFADCPAARDGAFADQRAVLDAARTAGDKWATFGR